MKDKILGFCEGDRCGRNLCDGIIIYRKVENCSCHISPPCSACVEPRGECPTCGWDERNDVVINDYRCSINKSGIISSTLRELDKTKVDWHSKNHTHFSMICEGCYPPGTTKDKVLELVKGTFGGRFESFGNGKFRYIAYTD
jgi:hypothetical protein